MAKSKSINIFLIDGEPTGRVKCTMQNWTGIAYKIPRIKLDDCKDGKSPIVAHLKQTGIYFLLGENEDGNPVIYVGQAGVRKNGEGLLLRLLEHKKNEKESYYNDWNEVICFSTQNDAFGPTEISYLENRFTNLALNAGRYVVRNGNEPNPGNITEEKECELEEFIEYARIIVGVLGHKVFEPLIKQKTTDEIIPTDESAIFLFKGKYNAKGKLTNEGFVVLSGSEINPNLAPSVKEKNRRDRDTNKAKIKDNNILIDDVLLTSPSAAATFVGGCPLSGNESWHTEDGKSPKDY